MSGDENAGGEQQSAPEPERVVLRYKVRDTRHGWILPYKIVEGGREGPIGSLPSNWPPEFVEFVDETVQDRVTEAVGELREYESGTPVARVTFEGFEDRDPEIKLLTQEQ